MIENLTQGDILFVINYLIDNDDASIDTNPFGSIALPAVDHFQIEEQFGLLTIKENTHPFKTAINILAVILQK